MVRAGEWTQRVRAEIKKRRIAAGLGQKDLARAAGRDQPTISRFERGTQSLTLDEISSICDLLGRGASLLELLQQAQPPKRTTDLDELAEYWPSLSEGVRSSIVGIARERWGSRARKRSDEKIERVRRQAR